MTGERGTGGEGRVLVQGSRGGVVEKEREEGGRREGEGEGLRVNQKVPSGFTPKWFLYWPVRGSKISASVGSSE